MTLQTVNIPLEAEGNMTTLSRLEVEALLDVSRTGVYETFRRCCLAVLNSGSGESDSVKQILEQHRNFQVSLHPRNGGIELELRHPPASAFVDGDMIRGIREHLYAVLRDVLFAQNEIVSDSRLDLTNPEHLTSAVFRILRNAGVLSAHSGSRLVVCWGGHSIPRHEYEYTKQVGYQLGLRGLDICTGCGPGAMKGPMKGATIGHSKQRNRRGRYVGVSEPGIIAAESPNPIVNQLVIMPDIEKRLEAFLRLGHAFIIFPGGVGTAEELLYILGVLLHPKNAGIDFPLFLTGPRTSARYFRALDRFVEATLGATARDRYEIILGDPERVARRVRGAVARAGKARTSSNDATYFNWQLHVDPALQRPFAPNHRTVTELDLSREQPPHELSAALRCVFSAIVAGNIKDEGIRLVEQHGPLPIVGPPDVIAALDALLGEFIAGKRMTVRDTYAPPYVLRSAA